MKDTRACVSVRKKGAQERSRFTRKVILEAATLIFQRKSYSEVTVSEISERAGVYDSAVTYHFQNKQKLFIAVLEASIDNGVRQILSVLENRSERMLDMGGIIRLLVPVLMNVYRQNNRLWWLPQTNLAGVITSMMMTDQADKQIAKALTELLTHSKEKGIINTGLSSIVLVKAIHAAVRAASTVELIDSDVAPGRFEVLKIFGIEDGRADHCLHRARREGLKPQMMTILVFMAEHPKVTIGELESALGMKRRSLQRYLRDLVNRGFIWEIGTGATDPTKFYELL